MIFFVLLVLFFIGLVCRWIGWNASSSAASSHRWLDLGMILICGTTGASIPLLIGVYS